MHMLWETLERKALNAASANQDLWDLYHVTWSKGAQLFSLLATAMIYLEHEKSVKELAVDTKNTFARKQD